MLKLNNIHLQRGTKILLNQANLYIRPNEKVGLIGKNGSGKSSLFALIRGDIEADGGDLEMNKGTRFSHLSQEIEATERTALDFVLDGDHIFRDIETKINEAEKNHDGLLLSELHEKMLAIDGHNAKTRAATLLHGLGFSDEQCDWPVKSFSGGWRMRVNLAKTLMTPAEFMLLDEPTNHLDLEAIIWLEKWLKNLKATLIIISHDRDFLDNVTDHIAHIHQQKVTYYTGNYSSFEVQLSEQLALQQAMHEKQLRQRAHLQSYVDRFRYKASKAKQAQSRVKALEKMQLISAAHIDSPFTFEFKSFEKSPTPLLRLDKVDIGYDDKTILKKVDLTINPGDRYCIIGPNGAGKSTLIKLLSQELKPQSGEVFFHKDLNIGYFAQHQMEYLDDSASPLLHLQRIDKAVTEQISRNFLGGFNFQGDMALEPIKNFSGGEKARLALALLIWQQPNLLLLDEPTNHFDLDMRHALTLALQDYKGAIILISHDRHLIRTSTNELLLVYNQALQNFPFSIDDYPGCLSEFTQQESAVTTEKTVKNKKLLRQQAAQEREKSKAQKQRLKKLEASIDEHQKRLGEIESQLADSAIYQDESKDTLTELLKEQKKLKSRLFSLEDEWLELSEF